MEQELNLMQEWSNAGDDMLTEREERIENYKHIIPFGVSFLDKLFKGILNTDVILIGAKTGAGKTEMISTVASNVLNSGYSVAAFLLEAESKEASRRVLYRELAKVYHDKEFFPMNTCKKFNFVDWEAGDFDDVLLEKEKQLASELSGKLNKMFIRYKYDTFDTEQLKKEMISMKSKVDVFIVDHINMVDLDSDNENRAMTDLIATIRQTALVIKKPVIVVSHVRKSDPRNKTILPNLEDFHGTSNLAKICTKAIMIGPAYDKEASPTLFPTYMRACKFRKDGSRTRYAAVVNFDITKNAYEETFELGLMKNGDTEFEPITEEHKLPYWAKTKEKKNAKLHNDDTRKPNFWE
jgi:replicative DNA helicase